MVHYRTADKVYFLLVWLVQIRVQQVVWSTYFQRNPTREAGALRNPCMILSDDDGGSITWNLSVGCS